MSDPKVPGLILQAKLLFIVEMFQQVSLIHQLLASQ